MSNTPSLFRYCEFSGSKNISTPDVAYSGYGGVFFIEDYSGITIENCTFTQNLANHGAVIACLKGSGIEVTNNLAYNNYALESGSFLRSDYAYPKLLGNTIVDNHLLNSDVYEYSGAVHSFKSKPFLMNNIVYGNTSNCIENFQLYLSKPFYTRHNLVEGGYSGEGNLSADPAFLELTDAYYVPSETSLCKDAGTLNTEFLIQPTTDIYGNQRVYNNFPDIGCAEFHPFISLDENNNQHEVLRVTTYPNPAGNRIKFKSNLIAKGLSEVTIYDIRGRKVKTISGANDGELIWDLTDSKQSPVPAGVYLYSIGEGERTNVGKVVVIR